VRRTSTVPLAVFVSSFESGGTERQMTELIRRLDPGRFEVHGVCLQRTGVCLTAAAERASIADFPISGFRHPGTWKQMNAFARWCRAKRIAIVHTCDFYANVFGLPAASLAGVPVRIGSRRELNPDKSAAKILLQRASYAAAHRIVANSHAAASRLGSEYVPSSKIRIIPNGIDAGRFHLAEPVRRNPRVITVGNLRREKAHEVLIEAAASLV
jgi:glycosyltransferase involved in cell wall biosynthesis